MERNSKSRVRVRIVLAADFSVYDEGTERVHGSISCCMVESSLVMVKKKSACVLERLSDKTVHVTTQLDVSSMLNCVSEFTSNLSRRVGALAESLLFLSSSILSPTLSLVFPYSFSALPYFFPTLALFSPCFVVFCPCSRFLSPPYSLSLRCRTLAPPFLYSRNQAKNVTKFKQVAC